MNTIEHRLMELEAKVAFQDETIEVLIKESQSSSSMMSEAPEPPPPHY